MKSEVYRFHYVFMENALRGGILVWRTFPGIVLCLPSGNCLLLVDTVRDELGFWGIELLLLLGNCFHFRIIANACRTRITEFMDVLFLLPSRIINFHRLG